MPDPRPPLRSVSVVVPTYKEAAGLPRLLARVAALRAAHPLDLELIISDDNSQDGTEDLIREANLPWVRLLVRTMDRGLSPAVLDGISATGALTALGDTLAPPSGTGVAARMAEDHGTGSTFLQQLRVLHPVLAVLGGAFMAVLSARLARRSGSAKAVRAARGVALAVGVQLVAGVVNVLLSAPGWMQVLHLALALGVWLAFVRLGMEVLDLRGARR